MPTEAENGTRGRSHALKVLHVLDYWRNLDARYFHSILERHSAAYEVAFCLLNEGVDGPWVGGCFDGRVMALGAQYRWHYPWATVRLARRLRRDGIRLVHAHFFYPTLVAIIAAKLARVPLVYTRHHSDHNIRLKKPVHVWADGWCGRVADHVIAVSRATKRLMVVAEGVPESKVSVIYNGMDALPVPAREEVEKARRELTLGKSRVCLMIARLHEEKGHRVLFEAIPSVVHRAGDVLFLLAGDGPHRARIEREARILGVDHLVRFLGVRRDVPTLIELADVVVLPSLAESFGYAVVEAMSLGKPVVASDSGGLPEIILDNQTGLIVPLGEPQPLGEALAHVLLDNALARRLGTAGRERASFFSFERMIRGYEDVYQRVLGSAGN